MEKAQPMTQLLKHTGNQTSRSAKTKQMGNELKGNTTGFICELNWHVWAHPGWTLQTQLACMDKSRNLETWLAYNVISTTRESSGRFGEGESAARIKIESEKHLGSLNWGAIPVPSHGNESWEISSQLNLSLIRGKQSLGESFDSVIWVIELHWDLPHTILASPLP